MARPASRARTQAPWPVAAGLATLLMLAHGSVAAQSSYSVSTLKPTSTGAAMFPSCINELDEVFGNADYYKRTVFSFSAPGFVKLYDEYPTKWTATNATSLSPSKADSKAGEGQWSTLCGKVHNGTRLVDIATSKVVTLPAAVNWGPPNDAGTMVLNVSAIPDSTIWTPGAGVQKLPAPGYQEIHAAGLNNQGDVIGSVREGSSQALKAALWLGGAQFQLITPSFETQSWADAINDLRQILISTYVQVPSGTSTMGVSKMAVWDKGVLKPLLPVSDTRYVVDGLINNKGTVTASVGQESPVGVYTVTDRRAVIWQNGVLSDLTAYVNARGANLPAGTVVDSVLALNNKGSMLVSLRTQNLQYSVARLLAKP